MTRKTFFTTMLASFLACFTCAGCETFSSMEAQMEKPSARIVDVAFRSFDVRGITLQFEIEVENPYAAAIPLANLDYSIRTNDVAILSGSAPMEGTIPGRGTRVLTLPARIEFASVLTALPDITPGAVIPYEATLTVRGSAPGKSALALPLQQSGELPVPAPPHLALDGIRWGRITPDDARAVLLVNLRNRNTFPIDLKKIHYDLTLGGRAIVKQQVARQLAFEPGASEVLEIPITISPRDLGISAFNVVRGERADYALAGVLELGTPYGSIAMPFERAGRTTFTHE